MIFKRQRFLGNTKSLEVHFIDNQASNCQLDEIADEHRKWYDSLAQAKRDKNYSNCQWCIGSSTR